jgi:hypothetical protein
MRIRDGKNSDPGSGIRNTGCQYNIERRLDVPRSICLGNIMKEQVFRSLIRNQILAFYQKVRIRYFVNFDALLLE